jgi:DNA-binding transcriptional LysR family regulator
MARLQTWNALQDHACLIVRENGNAAGQRFDVWQLHRERDKTPARVRVHGPLASNSGELVRDWCLEGRGIMLRSLWDIAPQLASPASWCACCRPIRCPTPTSTGWRPTAPTSPGAFAC